MPRNAVTEVVSGILREQTGRGVALLPADGVLRTIPAADVQELTRQDVSLMPADLHKALSVEKLVDLVEYLTTLKGP